MAEETILNLTVQTMWLVLLLSLPPVIVAAGIGILVSLFQALTQIQEQTLAFAFKLIGVFAVLVLMARWLGGELYEFSQNLFDLLPRLIT